MLPADGWRRFAMPGGRTGYRFGAARAAGGAVTRVLVKLGKTLEIVAKGAQLTHELVADPIYADVVVRLGARQVCLQAGGSTRFVPGARFSARDAPAPAACPP